MSKIIIVTPEIVDIKTWGGAATFMAYFKEKLSPSKKYRVELLTLGFKGEKGFEKQSNIKIVRFFVNKTGREQFWTTLSRKALIDTFKDFNYQVYLYLKKYRMNYSTSNCICIFNDYTTYYYLDKVKNLGFKIIAIFHIFPIQSWKIYVNPGIDKNIFSTLPIFHRFLIHSLKLIKIKPTFLTKLFVTLSKLRFACIVPRSFYFFFKCEYNGICYSNKIIVPSQGSKNYILTNYNIKDEKKIEVIPWGVNGRCFVRSENSIREKVKQRYGIKDDDIVLLTLSRIHPQKGLEFVLKALEMLEERNWILSSRTKVFICGGHDNRFSNYYQSLKKMAQKLKEIKVYFPGFVHGEEKLAYLDLAKIFLLPSVFEPFGIALLEAMAKGLSIVSSNTDGPNDVVKSEFGELVDFTDVRNRIDNLANAIKRTVGRDLAKMGQASRDEVKKYTWDRTIGEINRLIIELEKI